MDDLDEIDRKVDDKKAARQFQALYQFLSSRGIVQLLPVPKNCDLQDLIFTANLGIVLEHLPAKDTVIVSNYKSKPRIGETEVGVKFFQSMGYNTIVPSTKFEGEAELSHREHRLHRRLQQFPRAMLDCELECRLPLVDLDGNTNGADEDVWYELQGSAHKLWTDRAQEVRQ